MAEIVNLNRARKAKARTEAGEAAAANRAKHGRTAAERERQEGIEARRRTLLDGAKLDGASDAPEGGRG
jgi:Domain of unknown function (DUF4169)